MQTIVGHDQEACLTKGSYLQVSAGHHWSFQVCPVAKQEKKTCIWGHTALQISRVRADMEESIPRKDSGAKAKQEWAVRSFPGPWYLLALRGSGQVSERAVQS